MRAASLVVFLLAAAGGCAAPERPPWRPPVSPGWLAAPYPAWPPSRVELYPGVSAVGLPPPPRPPPVVEPPKPAPLVRCLTDVNARVSELHRKAAACEREARRRAPLARGFYRVTQKVAPTGLVSSVELEPLGDSTVPAGLLGCVTAAALASRFEARAREAGAPAPGGRESAFVQTTLRFAPPEPAPRGPSSGHGPGYSLSCGW